MAARKCLYIAGLDAGNGEDLRLLTSSFLGGAAFESVTPGVGYIARGHGVLTGNSFLCSASSTPNNTVQVTKGSAAVRGTQSNSQGTYVINQDVNTEVTITAKHASLVRKDYVVIQVRDAGYASFNNDDWVLTTIDGTPGQDFPSLTQDCLPIARVTVQAGTGATVITASDIEDIRPQARANGCPIGVSNRSDIVDPQIGDNIWERSTESYLAYNGSTWVTIGANYSADWTAYTPACGGVTGQTAMGIYARFGRTVTALMGWKLNGSGSVTGSLNFTLPVPAYNPGSTLRYLCGVKANINGAWYSATGEINPSYNPSLLFNLATAGTKAWGKSGSTQIPTTWTNNSWVVAFANYEGVS